MLNDAPQECFHAISRHVKSTEPEPSQESTVFAVVTNVNPWKQKVKNLFDVQMKNSEIKNQALI